MRVLSSFNAYKAKRELALTIGFFDGVHVGHQKILKTLLTDAHSQNILAAAMTFRHHPLIVLGHPKAPETIMTCEQRLHYFEEIGIDLVFLIDFEKKIADVGAQQFIDEILFEKLHEKKVYIGENFRFGKDRKANVDFLKEKGKDGGFSVISIPPFKCFS